MDVLNLAADKRQRRHFSAALIIAVLLGGCGGIPPHTEVVTIATSARLEPRRVATETFDLWLLQRADHPGQDLVVYIEGDGHAWESRSRPSPDPTPLNPVALRLAILDESSNVTWIARPCQYVTSSTCQPAYWTSARFAPEVVVSMNAAIDNAKRYAGAERVHLVGYSGGGGIAVLVAARRTDIGSLRTIAGNLDHSAFTRHHGVSPMTASLNPADAAFRLAHLPQRHWIGEDDDVIVPAVAAGFLSRMRDTHCASIENISGARHGSGWESPWRKEGQSIPVCNSKP